MRAVQRGVTGFWKVSGALTSVTKSRARDQRRLGIGPTSAAPDWVGAAGPLPTGNGLQAVPHQVAVLHIVPLLRLIWPIVRRRIPFASDKQELDEIRRLANLDRSEP